MSPLYPPLPTPRIPHFPRRPLAAAALALAVCLTTAAPARWAPGPHASGLAGSLLSHPAWQLLLQLWGLAGSTCGSSGSGLPGDTYGGCDPNG